MPRGLAAGPDQRRSAICHDESFFRNWRVPAPISRKMDSVTLSRSATKSPMVGRAPRWPSSRGLKDPANPSAGFTTKSPSRSSIYRSMGWRSIHTDPCNDFSFDTNRLLTKNDRAGLRSQASTPLYAFDYGGSFTLKATASYGGSALEATIDFLWIPTTTGSPMPGKRPNLGSTPPIPTPSAPAELDSIGCRQEPGQRQRRRRIDQFSGIPRYCIRSSRFGGISHAIKPPPQGSVRARRQFHQFPHKELQLSCGSCAAVHGRLRRHL